MCTSYSAVGKKKIQYKLPCLVKNSKNTLPLNYLTKGGNYTSWSIELVDLNRRIRLE